MVIKYLKAVLFDYRLRRAKRKAQKDADLYGKKYLVLVRKGRPWVVSKQAIRKLIRMHRFAKGFTPEKAEQIALYVAMPKIDRKGGKPCS